MKKNINDINSLEDYNSVDVVNKKRYFTSCVFPSFDMSTDLDLIPIMQNSFGINKLFSNCDLSIADVKGAYCDSFSQKTRLKVDKKGIEGAAVTSMATAGSAAPDEYEEIYEVLNVNHSFGYVLTDVYDTIIFSGAVNSL